MNKILLTMGMPVYNEEKYIGDCLKSIVDNRTPDFLEVIVIDNASTDGTSAVAKQFPGVRVVHEPEKGLTKARQRGLMEAKGDLVAYIDADTRVAPGWITSMLAEFAELMLKGVGCGAEPLMAAQSSL